VDTIACVHIASMTSIYAFVQTATVGRLPIDIKEGTHRTLFLSSLGQDGTESTHLPPQARKQLQEVGWTKGLELAKLTRRERQHFDCATCLHRAREIAKEQFKQEVEEELTGLGTEPWEIIYFKLYQSQMPVIERAIETAALMGSDRSRGYCLETICADFLAGANLAMEIRRRCYFR